jgi:CheY-specific phosphatase CheX
VDLGAIFISERLESDKDGGIDLGKRIRKIRPELPLYLRRHSATGLSDLKPNEQRAFRQGYQIEQIADLAQDLEKSISSHVYPNDFVRGICEITQSTLQSQFKNLKLEVESPFIVSDHLIYGDIFTLIPVETSWCRGYMTLQANEEELVDFVLAEKTRFESPKNKNAFDQYAFVGEVTNMVWGAFKNRFNDFQAIAGTLPQVPIVIKHLDRYISFGSKNPQLSLRCVLTDPENENAKPVEIFQRFVFNLGWSPDDYKDNQAQMEQLVDAGELELF